jgi:hypothetical protein
MELWPINRSGAVVNLLFFAEKFARSLSQPLELSTFLLSSRFHAFFETESLGTIGKDKQEDKKKPAHFANRTSWKYQRRIIRRRLRFRLVRLGRVWTQESTEPHCRFDEQLRWIGPLFQDYGAVIAAAV